MQPKSGVFRSVPAAPVEVLFMRQLHLEQSQLLRSLSAENLHVQVLQGLWRVVLAQNARAGKRLLRQMLATSTQRKTRLRLRDLHATNAAHRRRAHFPIVLEKTHLPQIVHLQRNQVQRAVPALQTNPRQENHLQSDLITMHAIFFWRCISRRV
jgi:hypothetical protein